MKDQACLALLTQCITCICGCKLSFNLCFTLFSLPNCHNPSNLIILFPLQIDMEDEREVRREDAAALAKFYNISYIETSSMRGVNVEEAFRTITQEVYDKVSPQTLFIRKETRFI